LSLPTQGCFNCLFNNRKKGYCDTKGEQYGTRYENIGKHSEKSIKTTGSSCITWKQGIDLFAKWDKEKVKERVKFT